MSYEQRTSSVGPSGFDRSCYYWYLVTDSMTFVTASWLCSFILSNMNKIINVIWADNFKFQNNYQIILHADQLLLRS